MPPRVVFRALAAASVSWLLAALCLGWIAWTPAFFLSAALLGLLWVRTDGRPWRERPTEFCFLACLTLYLSTFRWHGGDDITNSLVPLAVLRHHTLALTPVISPFLSGKAEGFTVRAGSELLSFHPIATGILAIPFYLLPVAFHAPISEQFLHNLSKVSASFITAASVAVFYRAVAARASRSWALATTMFYGLGSFAFSVSSQALWQHGTAQLAMALAFWGCAAQDGAAADALAGFGLALSIAARPDSVFLAGAIGLWLLVERPKRIPWVALAALPVFVPLLAYWHHYTGRFLPPATLSQESLFAAPTRDSVLGLLLSPTRGLLPYCPLVAFAPFALATGGRGERRLSAALLAGSAATWAFLSCYGPWVGGESYGPRYFATVATALLYLSAHLEKPLRSRPDVLRGWAAAGAFGVWVHALGGYLDWPGAFDVGTATQQVWLWRLHPTLNLLSPEGPLGALPAAVRSAIAAGGLLGCGAFAFVFARRLALTPAAPQPAAVPADLVNSGS